MAGLTGGRPLQELLREAVHIWEAAYPEVRPRSLL
jgi:hypothetical protein